MVNVIKCQSYIPNVIEMKYNMLAVSWKQVIHALVIPLRLWAAPVTPITGVAINDKHFQVACIGEASPLPQTLVGLF